jgi:hypothetical protein
MPAYEFLILKELVFEFNSPDDFFWLIPFFYYITPRRSDIRDRQKYTPLRKKIMGLDILFLHFYNLPHKNKYLTDIGGVG